MNLIKRIELNYLDDWLLRQSRKPLVIRGARQVGKSTLVRQFAEQAGLTLVTFNLERNPEFQQAFSQQDPKQILQTLALLSGKKLSGAGTLLFFDEIQAAPGALACLRYFYEELPQLPIIAAGSLLEFALADMQYSMPVGRIEYLQLGPVQLEDFLLACNEQPLAEYLQQFSLTGGQSRMIPEVVHQKLLDYLQRFWIVGGMPEAVAIYADTQDFGEVARVHHSIVDTYRDDFNKYAQGKQNKLVQLVFDQLPVQVGRKLKYTNISHDYRSADIANALNQLCLAKIASKVCHSSANGIPLGAEKNERLFKTLFLDIGLLSAALKLNVLHLRQQDLTLVNNGALAEQFVGQHLLYAGNAYQSPELYYWQREAKSAAAELDYVITHGRRIFPVEIKAGKTGTLKSLHQFLNEKRLTFGLRFNADHPSILPHTTSLTDGTSLSYQLLSLPLYLAGQTQRILKECLAE